MVQYTNKHYAQYLTRQLPCERERVASEHLSCQNFKGHSKIVFYCLLMNKRKKIIQKMFFNPSLYQRVIE